MEKTGAIEPGVTPPEDSKEVRVPFRNTPFPRSKTASRPAPLSAEELKRLEGSPLTRLSRAAARGPKS